MSPILPDLKLSHGAGRKHSARIRASTIWSEPFPLQSSLAKLSESLVHNPLWVNNTVALGVDENGKRTVLADENFVLAPLSEYMVVTQLLPLLDLRAKSRREVEWSYACRPGYTW